VKESQRVKRIAATIALPTKCEQLAVDFLRVLHETALLVHISEGDFSAILADFASKSIAEITPVFFPDLFAF